MIDLTTMSTAELRQLQVEVKTRLEAAKTEEVMRAREQVREIARNAGVTLNDLFMSGKNSGAKQTRRRKPKNEAAQGA